MAKRTTIQDLPVVEHELSAAELLEVQGGTTISGFNTGPVAVTLKYPSDGDDFIAITLAYPSDDDPMAPPAVE